MNEAQFWVITISTSVTALVTFLTLVIGLARRPFKALRDGMSGAVAEIKRETDSISSDLADIKGYLRNHDEVLRDIQDNQRLIVKSLEGVVPEDTHEVVVTAMERSILPWRYAGMGR